jgi:hypothetical protein
MSDHSQIIVDIEVSAQDAEPLAGSIREWLAKEGIIEDAPSDSALAGPGYRPGLGCLAAVSRGDGIWRELLTNGLGIRIGRQVFEASGNEIELQCANCCAEFCPKAPWFEAVDQWDQGDDAVTFECPSCGRQDLLSNWRGPFPWAFGNLGFEFWNWPPLSDEFLRRLSERLGHRTLVVWRHV